MKRLLALASLAFFLLAPGLAGAQIVNISTGAVDGKVTDATDSALAGVTITIAGDSLMGSRSTSTDQEGRYRLPALPPGDYAMAFELQGFAAVQRDRVRIGVGFTATIDVTLDIAPVQELLTVRRQSPAVDKRSTNIAATFDADQLANLPGARNTAAILGATTAVFVSRFDVGGNTAALGIQTSAFGTAGNNRPMVEGIDATGVQGTGFTFDYGSFEETLVTTAAHAAEWPKPGVQSQFIVKSGGNRYHGTFYGDYETRHWQSVNIDEDQIARGAGQGVGLSPFDSNRLWSYHDLNADLGGPIAKDTLWWFASFRDQEVAARYVNFPVKPHRTRLTNYSGKGTYQITPGHRLFAYGQAGRHHQPTRLDPSGLTTGLNGTTAIHTSEGSTTDQSGWGWILKGEWNAIVGDQMFLEVRAGQFGADRHEQPNGSAPRFEDVITLNVSGAHREFLESIRRDQMFASISRFKDGWLGTHQFKAGGEVYRTTEANSTSSGYPGDVLHVLRNGRPSEVVLFETPSRAEAGFWAYAGYINDSWLLNDRLTLNLGVRFDRFRIFLPDQEHPAGRFNPTALPFPAVDNVIDWNVPAPRVGVVFSTTGNNGPVLKFNYGQYWVNPGVATGFNANPNSNPWFRRYGWSDLDGSGVWDSGEETGAPSTRGGAAIEELDPALDLPFVREIEGAVEHELRGNVGVRAAVVWRSEQQHLLRQNLSWPFEAFAVPVLIEDPGPDNVPKTADDGASIEGRELLSNFVGAAQVNEVRNVRNSDSDYWTLDVTANRRFGGRWSMAAGFAHTWSHDQNSMYFGQAVRQNPFPLTPNDLINTTGNGQYRFRVWTAKVHGTYEAPAEIRITPFLRHQSGQPFGRTFVRNFNYANNVRILSEPLGTRRMDSITLFDVRIEKGFRLPARSRVAIFVDVFNLFNGNAEQGLNWTSGPSFLQPVSIVAPRIARIGAKLNW